jgi:hypothetical protein
VAAEDAVFHIGDQLGVLPGAWSRRSWPAQCCCSSCFYYACLGRPFDGREAARIVSAPPTLGQHSDEVLAGLSYGAEEIAGLRRAGVI